MKEDAKSSEFLVMHSITHHQQTVFSDQAKTHLNARTFDKLVIMAEHCTAEIKADTIEYATNIAM